MPSFFSVRLAPGVRLSASTRGLRAHVGPRVARVHVGGGRTGLSTGAGPVTLYSSGSSARPRRARASYSTGATRSQLAVAAKREQAGLIEAQLESLGGLHRQRFDAVSAPTAPLPALPAFDDLLAAEEREALRGVPFWERGRRRTLRRQARARAEQAARRLLAEAHARRRDDQVRLDGEWRRVLANDEDVVLPLLEAAFADNAAPVVAVGCEDRDVSISVLVPDEAQVPERLPSRTAQGNLSLPKATKTQRAAWYRQLVAGHMMLSVRETLATAPGAMSVTVVAVRLDASRLTPLVAARVDRTSLLPSPSTTDAWTELTSVDRHTLVRLAGVARELRPLDLQGEPDLQRLVDAFVGMDER